MRRLTTFRRRDEGVIAMVVAMLFGFGVMLALGALTVDVGNINADRRQLQNGADAVALSVAQQCAKAGTCSPADTDLPKLANLNAATSMNRASEIRRVDGQAAICGNVTSLAACSTSSAPDTNNLQECPAATLPSGAKFVRVYTETKNATSGKNLLPYSFGAAIAGAGSGANQQTCSSAAWGPAGANPVLPFAFSLCDWHSDTKNGTDYATFTPASNRKNDPWEHAVDLNSASDTGCASWQNHDSPGGFGWLDYDSTTCKVATPIGLWYAGDTGVGAGNQCGSKIEGAVGTVVYLPIFDCADDDQRLEPCAGNLPNGSNIWYHMAGAAAFYLTGVEITGQLNKSLPSYPGKAAKDECKADTSGNKKCFYGWFLKDLVDPSAVLDGDGTDLGLKAIQVVG